MSICQEKARELVENAKKIASSGKGILAADESTGTIKKRFDQVGVENTEANRAAYRELLFKTQGLNQYISGVILYEETLFQTASCGEKMTDLLLKQGILPGIKVDTGLTPLPFSDGETSTTGLDGLGARCKKYYEAGARFAKWRAVLTIDQCKGKPSCLSISETAHTLARYAAICQENGIVPIIEPEILADGNHDIEVCAKVTEKVWAYVIKALHLHHVILEGSLLKPNMVTPGVDCPKRASPQEIAFFTVRTLMRTIPPAVAGIMFLSGGQSEEEASLCLCEMNKIKECPLFLSFSYGRALQASVLKAWKGNSANTAAAQQALLERAKANSEAQLGIYKGGVGGSSASEGLFVKSYIY
ncbi:fructose-1,6-bisphosphate aldolase [Cryptosporidium felis]|nr:fructose-1,6-bisphosphate aldolase [Cryptosporidium felis]